MRAAEEPAVDHVISRDGTEIGYFSSGEGPPLLLVHGGLGDHSRWDALRPYLEPEVRVHAMDRRGRGVSGDTLEYDLEREFQDVVAVVDAAAETSGTPVDVYAHSAGGIYTFGAAALTGNISRIICYEGWDWVTPEAHVPAPAVLERMEALLEAGDREGAVEVLFREAIGVTDDELEQVRAQPSWPARVVAAHTVPREVRAFLETDFAPEHDGNITMPVLFLVGAESPQSWMTDAETVAAALPDAQISVLEGQAHSADMLAPELVADKVLTFLQERS